MAENLIAPVQNTVIVTINEDGYIVSYGFARDFAEYIGSLIDWSQPPQPVETTILRKRPKTDENNNIIFLNDVIVMEDVEETMTVMEYAKLTEGPEFERILNNSHEVTYLDVDEFNNICTQGREENKKLKYDTNSKLVILE